MNVKFFSAIAALALASMACGVTVDLPRQSQIVPEIKDSIKVANPKSEEAAVNLSFGAGTLTLSTGAKNLVEGTVLYNIKDLEPEVNVDSNGVEIKQGEFRDIPPWNDMKNEWDLQLGKALMDLEISAGAYDGDLELGGLSLKSLSINDGASDVKVSFSEPNRVEMSEFRYTTGASSVRMEGLANANFNTFIFNSGAGEYTLDFSGELQHDAIVSIDCGFSDLTLIIPNDVNAIVTIDSTLASISFDSGWSQKNHVYTQKGEGPRLTIVVNMGAGDINVHD